MSRTRWRSYPDEIPPRGEYYYAFTHSIDVLCYDGKDIRMGCLQVWEDDDSEPQWKTSDRDGHNIENVTHWMYLPETP